MLATRPPGGASLKYKVLNTCDSIEVVQPMKMTTYGSESKNKNMFYDKKRPFVRVVTNCSLTAVVIQSSTVSVPINLLIYAGNECKVVHTQVLSYIKKSVDVLSCIENCC